MPAPIRWMDDTFIFTGRDYKVEPHVMALRSGYVDILTTGPANNPYINATSFAPTGTALQVYIVTSNINPTYERAGHSIQLSDGRFVSIYTQETSPADANARDVWLRVTYANSTTQGLGTSTQYTSLVAGGPDHQIQPTLAAGTNGSFAVAWLDLAGTDSIKFRTYSQDGTASAVATVNVSAPAYSNDAINTDYDSISVLGLTGGRYVVAWTDSTYQSHFRIYHSSGIALTNELDLPGGQNSFWPQLIAMTDGRFAAVYFGTSTARFTIFNADGTVSRPEVVLGASASDFGAGPTGTGLDDGRIVFVWKDGGGELVGRIYNADGTPDGAVFSINQVTTGNQGNLSIDTMADGRLMVAWETTENGTNDAKFTIFDPRETGQEIVGTTDNDYLVGTRFGDTIVLGIGNDRASGGDGNDRISGGVGSDWLFGDAGNDTLEGGVGDDTLDGGIGADVLHGGLGIDTASYANAIAGVIASLATPSINTGEAAGDTYVSIENLTGSGFHDRLYGAAGANILTGGDGNDILHGGAGADSLDGGNGIDGAAYWNAPSGLTASLVNAAMNTGEAAGDTYFSIENLYGSNFGDRLYGNGGANALVGNGGNDLLHGGAGADQLYGGDGIDGATYWDALAGVNAALITPSTNTGDAAADTYSSIENLYGSAFADQLRGDNAVNALIGNNGADTLYGFGGSDDLYGGNGTDHLVGGLGNDRLWGGADADVFYGVNDNGRDRIEDWQDGIDLINLRSVSGVNSFADVSVVNGTIGALVYWGSGADGFWIVGKAANTIDAGDFTF